METDAAFEMDAPICPAFKLTRHDLDTKDFVTFAQQVFREQPDLPMFKIVPPAGWAPTRSDLSLEDLVIHTPIQQLVRA
jgi:[histone H3]-trimethyl-L-lysine9/36 demethylase